MATRYALIVEDTVTSTQDVAFRAFRNRPVAVVAEHQVGGRGRSGRQWQQPDRGLFASVAFAPEWPQPDWPRLALAAGVAARDVFPHTDLKWPNDLLLDGRKAGGILSEAQGPVVTIGLGVNLWWTHPPAFATALLDTDPGRDETTAFATEWVGSLLDRVARGSASWGLDEYRSACATLGRSVSWGPGLEGVAVGIDEYGRLLVETREEMVALESGEVHLLP
jgi:BirA family transcriptional regulator, biotin operon repressor / biotin---[acetyl-CoA-carboxylase] ligase